MFLGGDVAFTLGGAGEEELEEGDRAHKKEKAGMG